jgi:hypothetical protein
MKGSGADSNERLTASNRGWDIAASVDRADSELSRRIVAPAVE